MTQDIFINSSKDNANQPSFPIVLNEEMHRTGLSKREYIATMALQGLLANSKAGNLAEDNGKENASIIIARASTMLADALLSQLNNTDQK